MPTSGIIQKASIQRHKYLVISNLPLQGVSIISCVSLYKTQSTAYMTHQLMKDDFPAEWLPIRRTTIFFRGASRLRLNCSAILIKPERWIKKTNCWKQRVFPSRIMFHKFVIEKLWVTDIIYKQLKLHEMAIRSFHSLHSCKYSEKVNTVFWLKSWQL